MLESDRILVKESIEKIGDKSSQIIDSFYSRLFDVCPAAREIFKQDQASRNSKFNSMLATISNLRHFDILQPAMLALGNRHQDYGVEDSYYVDVKRILIESLAENLPGGMQEEEVAAWSRVLDELVGTMRPEDNG